MWSWHKLNCKHLGMANAKDRKILRQYAHTFVTVVRNSAEQKEALHKLGELTFKIVSEDTQRVVVSRAMHDKDVLDALLKGAENKKTENEK